MAKDYDFKWRGDVVREHVERAARIGIDTIMSRCINSSKGDVPVASASYQGSIMVQEPAEIQSGEVSGVWGSVDLNYALGVETGDYSYLKGQPSEKDGKSVPTRKNKGHRGSLRKAADEHYPDLAPEIARAMR